MKSMFSNEFHRKVQSVLRASTKDETCIPAPVLAREIADEFGIGTRGKRNQEQLEKLASWLTASVSLGLFDTETVYYVNYRGRTGGIQSHPVRARKSRTVEAVPARDAA